MIEQLIELDKELFLFLNGMNAGWLDPVMELFSKTIAWIPLYVFLLYHIVATYKQRSWVILLAIALTILMTDQITSGFMKPFFERLRPSHDPAIGDLVHLVNDYRGGTYGFASSHAANTFGTATFLYLLFKKVKWWISWLFLWAAVVSYSRIYMGIHYPGDILAGAFVGLMCGWVVFNIYERSKFLVEKKRASSLD